MWHGSGDRCGVDMAFVRLERGLRMMAWFGGISNKRKRIVAGAIGGLAGSAAYSVAQHFDMKVLDHNTDDFLLLGTLMPVDDDLARPLGAVMHFGNGALLGIAYALIGRDRLPGSPFARGMTWTMMETFGLYPMALLEKLHPAIRDGRLESYLSGKGFAQQLVRHIAYGAVLGPVTDRFLEES